MRIEDRSYTYRAVGGRMILVLTLQIFSIIVKDSLEGPLREPRFELCAWRGASFIDCAARDSLI